MAIDFSDPITKETAIATAKRLMNNDFQLLTLPTGAGKTAIAVATAGIFAHIYKEPMNVFVVAPRKKLDEASWEAVIGEYNQIAKYPLHLVDQSTPQGLYIADDNDKLRKKDIRALPKHKQQKMKFIKKGWRKQLKNRRTVFLVDEVHMFKNPTSRQSKSLKKLAKGDKIIGLTATPMSNGLVQDGVSYLVLNGFYNSKNQFENYHDLKRHHDKYHRPDVYLENGDIDPHRFKYLDDFMNAIHQTIFSPKVNISSIQMPETSVYAMSYNLTDQSLKDMKQHHKDYRKRRYDNYMLYLSDLRKTVGYDLNHARMLAKILINKKPKQPLIFYNTNAELENIQFCLEKMNYPYTVLNGNNKLDASDYKKNQAIVIQYKAGSAGIEFKNSNLTVFFGLQYSWQDTSQAMGRNVRRNMKHKVTQIFLVASESYDNRIFDSLQRKEHFTKEYLEMLADDISKDGLS